MVLFLSIANAVLGLASPYAVKIILDDVLLRGHYERLPIICVALLASTVVSAGLGLLSNYIFTKASQGMLLRLRMDLLHHYHRLEARLYSHVLPGDFVSRFLNDIFALQSLVTGGIFSLSLNALSAVVMLVVMFLLNTHLGLFALLSVPVFLLASRLFSPVIQRSTLQIQQQMAAVTESIQEAVEAAKLTRFYGQEATQEARVKQILREQVARVVRGALLSQTAGSTLTVIAALTPLAVLWYGGTLVLAGRMTPGDLVAFVSYLAGFYGPVQALSQLGVTLQSAWAVLGRVTGVLDLPEQDWPGTEELSSCQGDLEVRDVWFGYDPRPILCGISLSVPAESSLVISGPSGVGKSTLAMLIAGLYSLQNGVITLDDKPIMRLSRDSLARWIAVVPQEVFVFNDTFEANIRFGDQSQPFEKVMEAARRARAHEFIMETSQGYHTVVGSRGSRLSGGQRQRIALARALLRHPAVLILDEAITSVDAAEEFRIQEALQDIEHACTTIIITHRPESYPWIRRRVVLEEGQIKEETEPASLEVNGIAPADSPQNTMTPPLFDPSLANLA